MILNPKPASGEHVIRLSLTWVVLIGVAVLALGAMGGMIAQWWWQPNLPPLPTTEDRLITTIQEVTISPSTATAELTKNHERSVVLLARAEQPSSPVATGLVVTSDGIIATLENTLQGELVAIDGEERTTPLTHVGNDVVYGITYLRASRGVFSPFDVRDSDAAPGTTLTLLTRSPETLTPKVHALLVEEYRLPEKADAAGWQRLLGATRISPAAATGSPLLDDEGRVAALLLPGEEGKLLPGVLLRRSLERVASGNLEQNPISERGLAFDYTFTETQGGTRQFTVVVESVALRSAAAQAGVRTGDLITTINNKPVNWEEDIAAPFREEVVALSVRRGEETLNIALPRTAQPSPVS